MMVDSNRETFSVMDELAQEAANVMMYVYALRSKEVIPFF